MGTTASTHTTDRAGHLGGGEKMDGWQFDGVSYLIGLVVGYICGQGIAWLRDKIGGGQC